jgi:subtilisin family serine protease
MILKYYDPSLNAVANLQNEVRAFRYAIQMKAQIINFSGGGAGANQDERAALRLAEEKQILVVAAAGNEGVDTDRFPYYPADYGFKNILSVTAVDPLRRLPIFANYGSVSTHIAAPGEHILSTALGGGYTQLSGTSQATALASGLAALLLSRAALSPDQVIEKIKAGSRFENSLLGRSAQPGILNAYRSLAMKSSDEPAVTLDLPLNTERSTRYIVPFQ